MHDYLSKRKRNSTQTTEDHGERVGETVLKQALKGLVDLYEAQNADIPIHLRPQHPRSDGVRDIVKCVALSKVKRLRTSYSDRGVNTVLDGYTPEDHDRIIRYTYRNDAFPGMKNSQLTSLRIRLAQLMGHACFARGDTRRNIEFADLFCMSTPEETYAPCQRPVVAVVAVSRNGKTNRYGKIQYAAMFRHRLVHLCPIGAMAQWFFYRFHVLREQWPDFCRPCKWHEIKLFQVCSIEFTPVGPLFALNH